jgi:diadenosine tetraphosphate (Ap4A) HIT family hydrolase
MMTPMRASGCPFCNPAPARVFLESDLIVGVWDAFPVSAGHALLVTRRHVASWFETTEDERRALTAAIDSARGAILQRHRPDGFNMDVNVGAAAGQTIPHLHVHVIPRYAGDVPDPRGGFDTLSRAAATTWSMRDLTQRPLSGW